MSITITQDVFGSAKDPFTKKDTAIHRFTFCNDNNMSVQVITLGATITSIIVPDGAGNTDDVVCGFDNVEGYQASNNPYFGATVGRVANRVGFGKFILNCEEINVSKNWNDRHQLHGGFIGFDKVHWTASIHDNQTVVMSHVSEDGHEGYPGKVAAIVVFQLTEENEFRVCFSATTTKPTPINLTNHSYFNLAGHNAGSQQLYEHLIKIKADKITVTDSDSIPTGEFMDVDGTPYDLRTLGKLGPRLQKLRALGYDDNFCVTLDHGNTLTTIAKVSHPKSGRWMEVATDQPGVQFYTSNFMPDPAKNEAPIIGKEGAKYFKHGALCLETQKYPDAVNHENFPSIILNPKETYTHEVIYRFGACKEV
ncbi:galactose mutarotase [Condylostylus longicornis]|uniref:galactose mutarotase n=1 Tax=Condylostylus longicornis TaxID=2530218 RepID=UPI00244D9E9A|nr:galactose mutarotase [Condylostylus longicornis]